MDTFLSRFVVRADWVCPTQLKCFSKRPIEIVEKQQVGAVLQSDAHIGGHTEQIGAGIEVKVDRHGKEKCVLEGRQRAHDQHHLTRLLFCLGQTRDIRMRPIGEFKLIFDLSSKQYGHENIEASFGK